MTQEHPLLQAVLEEIAKLNPDYRPTEKVVPLFKEPKPAHLTGEGAVAQDAAERVEWSAETEARVRSALKVLSADCPYDEWLGMGMALHWLEWDERGLKIWDDWSRTAPARYQEGVCEAKWGTFKRGEVTIRTLWFRAYGEGWQAPLPPKEDGTERIPAPAWPVLVGSGRRTRPAVHSPANVAAAVGALEVECRYDEFHDRILIGGEQYCENQVVALMRRVLDEFGWEPGKDAMHNGIVQYAFAHKFNPIREYLAALVWDRTPRLGSWMVDYLGAPDTELVRAIGRIHLIAAVRRVRQPGCKYDYMVVLEGGQGNAKSWAIATLAGQENFSDNPILGESAQRQQELLAGVWHYECSELEGLQRKDFGDTKAFITRQWDRSRPAYERRRIDRPRQCVLWGTTNETRYLGFEEGLRRFVSVPIANKIDIGRLAAVRDQLFAEAVIADDAGEELVLPTRLSAIAAVEQEKRVQEEPWEELLAALKGTVCDGEERILSESVFAYLGLMPHQRHAGHSRTIAKLMRKLGWIRATDDNIRVEGKRGKGYFRSV